MNNSVSDFSGVKEGDKLWMRSDEHEGEVIVDMVENTAVRVYYANIYNQTITRWLSTHGRFYPNGPQVLFYDKVKITPPPRPRRMVKKTIEVRPYLDPHTQTIEVTSHLNCVLDYCGPIQKIEIEVWED